MAGIKQPIQDILNKLSSIEVENCDTMIVPLYSRVWNNQLRQLEDGEIYNFPLPAAFLEVVSPVNYNRIGSGYSDADVIFKIHIGSEYLNGEGTFEQDLVVFDIRDKVIRELSNYQPTGCGALMISGESQSYDHNNVYHYEVDFTCSFIDSKGSPYDEGRTDIYIEKTPPTQLQLIITNNG